MTYPPRIFKPGSILADNFKEEPVTVSLVDPVDASGNPFAVNASANAVEHRKVIFSVTNNSRRPIRHKLIVIKKTMYIAATTYAIQPERKNEMLALLRDQGAR